MWPMGILFFPNAKRLLKDYGGKDVLCHIENNGDIDSSVTMAFMWGILRGGKLGRSLCFTLIPFSLHMSIQKINSLVWAGIRRACGICQIKRFPL